MFVHHQVSLSSADTIIAKDNLERDLGLMGVNVENYHTDNGVFKSKAFTKEILTNKQAIRFSGVGAKWQNGCAEGAIKHVITKARILQIHAKIHWPEANDATLWTLAVTHAAHMHNHTPN